MAKFPRHATNGTLTLTTRTPASRNSFGEQEFTETTTQDDAVLQFVDQLEDPAAGNLRMRKIIAVTDPENLTPTTNDEATVDGVAYRILEVRPIYWKGIKIAEKVQLQERG